MATMVQKSGGRHWINRNIYITGDAVEHVFLVIFLRNQEYKYLI